MVFYKMLITIFCIGYPIRTQMTIESPQFFYCPILESHVMNNYEFLIPCHIPTQSHIVYKKKFLNFMLQVGKISLVDVA